MLAQNSIQAERALLDKDLKSIPSSSNGIYPWEC